MSEDENSLGAGGTSGAADWSDAVGAWVPLVDVARTVERELGITSRDVRGRIREPLERNMISFRVIGYPGSFDERGFEAENYVSKRSPSLVYSPHPSFWDDVDWPTGTKLNHRIELLWSDVILQFPDEVAVRDARRKSAGVGNGTDVVKGKGGAPPKHDWEAFWMALAWYAHAHGLESEHRNELRSHMESWTAEHMGETPPDKATIRERLTRLYKARGTLEK